MSNGSEHIHERCEHAADEPDWAGLRDLYPAESDETSDQEPYVHPQHERAAVPHTGIGWKYDPRPLVPEGGANA